MARPDENFQKCLFYVWTKFQKFVWIGSKIAIFAQLSVCTKTNYVITHSQLRPINADTLLETGHFLPTPIHSLIPFSVERIIVMDTDTRSLYSLFSHIPFSTIVYTYLQGHFSPLTTTTVHTFAIFTIERGPVYLWELRCKVSPKPITIIWCVDDDGVLSSHSL